MTTAEFMTRRARIRKELSQWEAKLEETSRKIRMGKRLVATGWLVTIVSCVFASIGHWDNGWLIPAIVGGVFAIWSSSEVWTKLNDNRYAAGGLIKKESEARAEISRLKEEMADLEISADEVTAEEWDRRLTGEEGEIDESVSA